ncbi:hypothetical protein [Klebsiella variicola]|uniref:hypothetical protein n=1 Tax=Klebsiella variicola TaxID=244366 RepID=UPI003AF41E6C
MTDITELAQSEINDALAQLKQISEYPTPSTQYARVLRKYIATLVEALEGRNALVALQKIEIRELNAELEKAQQRIAELESRTVKLPEVRITIAEAKLRNLTPQQHDAYNAGASRAVAKICQELTAAGIKVEAE